MTSRVLVLAFAFAAGTGCTVNVDADGKVDGGGGGGGGGGGNNSGDGGGDGSTDNTGSTLSGIFQLGVVELGCLNEWDMLGQEASCSGCDLAFNVELYETVSECGSIGDLNGILELAYGAAYFNGGYVGEEYHSDGFLAFYTYEYQYGAYYTYLYGGGGYY